jgi:hypothetical protein
LWIQTLGDTNQWIGSCHIDDGYGSGHGDHEMSHGDDGTGCVCTGSAFIVQLYVCRGDSVLVGKELLARICSRSSQLSTYVVETRRWPAQCVLSPVILFAMQEFVQPCNRMLTSAPYRVEEEDPLSNAFATALQAFAAEGIVFREPASSEPPRRKRARPEIWSLNDAKLACCLKTSCHGMFWWHKTIFSR